MISLLSGDDWGIRRQHEMDSWVGHQVGLELSDVDVESAIKSEGGSQGRNDLSDQSIQISVSGSFNVQLSSADVINGFIIKHNGNVSMLKKRMS